MGAAPKTSAKNPAIWLSIQACFRTRAASSLRRYPPSSLSTYNTESCNGNRKPYLSKPRKRVNLVNSKQKQRRPERPDGLNKATQSRGAASAPQAPPARLPAALRPRRRLGAPCPARASGSRRMILAPRLSPARLLRPPQALNSCQLLRFLSGSCRVPVRVSVSVSAKVRTAKLSIDTGDETRRTCGGSQHPMGQILGHSFF